MKLDVVIVTLNHENIIKDAYDKVKKELKDTKHKIIFVDNCSTDNTMELLEEIQNYYKDIVKEKYYTSNECSYECFLKWRSVDRYLDHVSYYVREGKLIAFKSFIAHSKSPL